MKVGVIDIGKNVSAIVIDGLYTDEELEGMWTEIEFLEPKLGDENKTQAAVDPTPYGEKRKKRGRGVFLDEVYTDRRFSTILTTTRKLFFHPEIKTAVEGIISFNQDSLYWKNWERINHDSTLLQCYDSGDYYDFHADHALFTAITIHRSYAAKPILGGDLVIKSPDGVEYIHQPKDNSTIIFPSILEHKVTKVAYKDPLTPSSVSNYRWSVSHLISVR